jgi:arylsulfatase A-like enzyme
MTLHTGVKLRYEILGIGSDRANTINKKAIRLLRKNKSGFFLWLHYMDVHAPYNPGSFFQRIEAFRLSRKIKGGKNLSEYELRMLMRIYDSAIMYVDYEIGCLLDELKRMGISYDDVYIILIADHGEQFMEHGEIGHGALYDEVLYVPLIISGPGIEKSTVIKHQVSLLDLSPTILDLLCIPGVNSFQGKSLLPLINGNDNTERTVISEGGARFIDSINLKSINLNLFSFRTEEWKYILSLDEGKKQVKAELYNLIADPKEKENLIEREKIKADEFKLNILNHIAMEERLKADKTTEHETYNIREKKKIEERLRDLGYI